MGNLHNAGMGYLSLGLHYVLLKCLYKRLRRYSTRLTKSNIAYISI